MRSILLLILILVLGFNFYSINFLATILIISFLIFFHELGHFLAARSLGVKVEVFSIGFGEILLSKTINNTKYCLSALPLGGYVKLKGQDDLNPSLQNYDKDSYGSLSPIKKIYILLAGPFFNILLAFLLYIIIAFLGINKLDATIGKIAPNSAAQIANLKINDKILSINEQNIKSFDEISKLIKNKPLNLKVLRDNEILNITLTPKIGDSYNEFFQKIQKPIIGISPSNNIIIVKYTGFDAIKYAFNESIEASTLIIKGLIKLIKAEIDPSNLSGVITMVDITSKAANSGIVVLLLISALISINLGIVNLLPIPMLDGGHIMFNLYEIIFNKKPSPKAFEYLSYIGMALLLSLMLFATYNDITRIING